MEQVVLRTEGLTKRYGGRVTVDRVDLGVRAAEVYGFLGPNGAGKTTVMRLILGLTAPSAGRVFLFGEPCGGRVDARRRVGAVSEKPYLYPDMTAFEYLRFFADLFRVPDPAARIRHLLERLDLLAAADKRIRTFSQGMQQRVNIARGFLHDPDLLLLDEPVSSLDPHGIRTVRDMIVEARQGGRSVLISSHLLSIIETVCDRVAVMHRGRLLAESTVEGLRGRIGGGTSIQVEVAQVSEGLLKAVGSLSFVRGLGVRSRFITLKAEAVPNVRETISRRVAEAGGTVLGVTVADSSLEDAFLELTESNISCFEEGSS